MEIKVSYTLSDEQAKRLEALVPTFQEDGKALSTEEVFNIIMEMGSKKDIDYKLHLMEWKKGLVNEL